MIEMEIIALIKTKEILCQKSGVYCFSMSSGRWGIIIEARITWSKHNGKIIFISWDRNGDFNNKIEIKEKDLDKNKKLRLKWGIITTCRKSRFSNEVLSQIGLRCFNNYS